MSRNYMLIAAGVLLAAAAVVHFTGQASREPAPPIADVDPGNSANRPPASLGHKLVDPLVPPIQIEGINAGRLGIHDPFDDGHSPVAMWDPDSLVGRIAATADFSKDNVAHFHPHGEEVCASGCAASRHPTKQLTREHFHELLAQYATEPMDETSFALESLLYFGRQTQELLKEDGDAPLDPLRSGLLQDELKKTHAKIEIRVVDEFGEIRTWLPPTRVPLDRRHEFDMQVSNVQPLITSGTVKRVGLYHLWNRL